MTPEANQSRAPKVLAVLVILLFLFASLPEPPLGWVSALLFLLVPLVLVPVLLKWGPSLPSVGRLRIAIFVSAAVFVASLLSRAAEFEDSEHGVFVATTCVVLVLTALLIACSRFTPETWKSSLLRIGVFSAIALFGLCSRIARHRHFANMKDGDFFVVWLPFRLSIILPHPYDFYVVGNLITRLLWISMVAAIVLSGAYFGGGMQS
jgi:hypothetical protein